jgi:uncharacterized Fe-S cluster protein YjdI
MADQSTVKEYSNGEVTVIWQPSLCIHSKRCVEGLPAVFNQQARPWINAQGASTDQIVAQVAECPSGALSTRRADEAAAPSVPQASATEIDIIPNGPLRVSGPITIKGPDGEQTIDKPKVSLCRCGFSQNKPFCDGSHKKQGWSDQS